MVHGSVLRLDTKGVSLSQFGGSVNRLKQEHQLYMGNVRYKDFSIVPSPYFIGADKNAVFYISWQSSVFSIAQDNSVS